MNEPSFWQDKKRSEQVLKEAKGLKARVEPVEAVEKELRDCMELAELARDEKDTTVFAEIRTDLGRSRNGSPRWS